MEISDRYKKVLVRIETAANRAGRDPSEIKLIAVSKTHPIATIENAIDNGINIFGENRVQEAVDKVASIGREKAEWHLIGHLQKNKARKAVQNFDVIHTLDSQKLAGRLERISEEERREKLSVLIQVDIAGEESKSGIKEEDLPGLLDFISGCKHLKLEGLMIIPPYLPDPEKVRPYFKRLRGLRDKLVGQNAFANGAGELSMGMSHDFDVAIEEGATMVRVGTAIFGERQKRKRG
ncbi:MAG: YggS family pyridoxal phosphate-dependent enzyme [Pyrinomonadaceae bacterium]|nr:YggS family pyridoxal phosphate-dependent enzyme [Pyrinomonadaceae bacterium]